MYKFLKHNHAMRQATPRLRCFSFRMQVYHQTPNILLHKLLHQQPSPSPINSNSTFSGFQTKNLMVSLSHTIYPIYQETLMPLSSKHIQNLTISCHFSTAATLVQSTTISQLNHCNSLLSASILSFP